MYDDELHRFKSDIHLVQFAADRCGYQRDRAREQRLEPCAPAHRRPTTRSLSARTGTATGPTSRSATNATTARSLTSSSGAGDRPRSARSGRSCGSGSAPHGLSPTTSQRRLGHRATGDRRTERVRWPRASRGGVRVPAAREGFGERPWPTPASQEPSGRTREATCSSCTRATRARSPATRSRTSASRGLRPEVPRRPGRALCVWAIARSSSPRVPSMRSATTSSTRMVARPLGT